MSDGFEFIFPLAKGGFYVQNSILSMTLSRFLIFLGDSAVFFRVSPTQECLYLRLSRKLLLLIVQMGEKKSQIVVLQQHRLFSSCSVVASPTE